MNRETMGFFYLNKKYYSFSEFKRKTRLQARIKAVLVCKEKGRKDFFKAEKLY